MRVRRAAAIRKEVPWNELLVACRASFDAWASRHPSKDPERDELFRDVFLRVVDQYCTKYVADGGRASLRTWVARQVDWAIADYWRARYRRIRSGLNGQGLPSSPEPAAPAESTWSDLERAEIRQAVRDCLARLQPTQRDRLLAAEDHREGGLVQADLARTLGIALDTLKESLHGARRALRACLERKGLGPGREWAGDSAGGSGR